MNGYNSGLLHPTNAIYDLILMKLVNGLMNDREEMKREEELKKKELKNKRLSPGLREFRNSLFKSSSVKNVRQLSPRAHFHPSPVEPNGLPHPNSSDEKRIIKLLVAETTIPGFLDLLLSIVHRRRGEFGNVMFSIVSVHDPSRFNHELVRNNLITFVEDLFLLQLTTSNQEPFENIVLLATGTTVDALASTVEKQLNANALIMSDRIDLMEQHHLLESHVVSVILKKISILTEE